MTLTWNAVIIVLKWPIFFNFRKSLLPFGTTDSVLPGSAGVDWGAGGGGTTMEPYEVVSLDGLKRKAKTRFCLKGWKKRKRHKPKKTSWNRLQPVSACLFQTTGVQRTKMPMLMWVQRWRINLILGKQWEVESGEISGSSKRTIWIKIGFLWMKYITWKWYFRRGVLRKIALHFGLVMQDQIRGDDQASVEGNERVVLFPILSAGAKFSPQRIADDIKFHRLLTCNAS